MIVNTDWECTDTLGKPMLDFLSSNLGREHVYYATSDMGFASKNCRGHNIAGNSIIIPYVATHVIDQAAQNPDNLCNASTRTISFYFAGDLIRTDQGHYRKDVLNAMASQGSDAQVLHRRFRSVTDYHQMALEYRDNLLRSRYCLVPAGDTPTSRRLFDALAAGCIPVYLGSPKLLADEVPGVGESNLPFPRTLEWSSFVIFAGSMEWLHKGRNSEARSLGRQLQRALSEHKFERDCHDRIAAYSRHLSYFRNRAVATTLLSEVFGKPLVRNATARQDVAVETSLAKDGVG